MRIVKGESFAAYLWPQLTLAAPFPRHLGGGEGGREEENASSVQHGYVSFYTRLFMSGGYL